jgi:hypothetical protein
MITQLSDECKSRLFRLTLREPAGSVAFVMADTREAAWRIGKTVISVLHGVAIFDVALGDIHSFSELVGLGVSDDEDMRIFEIRRAGAETTEWAHAPYFLTNDASLLGKWAELCAERAASAARSAIRRAR